MNNAEMSVAQVDQPAPDFTLSAGISQLLSLSQMRGRPVVLVFYPADWSPVCGDQVSLYNEMLSEFDRYGARILGISVDGVWCHAAFSAERKLRFPLLADFEPKGSVASRYGVYDSVEGTCLRALFAIDVQGILRWKYVSPIEVNPGADGILRALDQIECASGSLP